MLRCIVASQGYQLLKDKKRYGSMLPPEVNHLTIKDVQLGERIELQILALTNHPVGHNENEKSSDRDTERDSGIVSQTNEKGEKCTHINIRCTTVIYNSIMLISVTNVFMFLVVTEVLIGDRYSACRPGPKLIVHYTGLVSAPSRVWSENVTGHTAVIVWNKSKHSTGFNGILVYCFQSQIYFKDFKMHAFPD